MITQEKQFDVVVCGGGLAGLCAAIASARHGAKTVIIQDRPVFGGNASSEVRVTVHGAGAHHAYARETGILHEILTEERARNHEVINENGWVNSVLDVVCYDFAVREKNLTVCMNTTVEDVILSGGIKGGERAGKRPQPELSLGFASRPACAEARRVEAVQCRVANAETVLVIKGKTFIDCTGDGTVADLAGCAWRMGSEGRAEFGEPHAPEKASADTMGNSIHIRARDMGRPCPFTPPDWAVKHRDPDYFYKQGRHPTDVRGGFWWIEIGMPWNTITDNETIRHELTRHALGIWDWMKNHDPVMKERCRNFALEWIGQVPGKRESRRILGRKFITEKDIIAMPAWPDEVAYGGWFIDLHTPGGLLAPTSEPAAAEGYNSVSEYAVKSYVGPYGLPLSICLAKDVDNLMMAGRNVSTTRAALGTVRVMGTTALLGQACGTAAAAAIAKGIEVHEVPEKIMGEVQQALLRDGCFLPNVKNADAGDLAPKARVTASSSAPSLGASPTGTWVSGGVERVGGERDRVEGHILHHAHGQLIAVKGGHVESVSACFTNRSGQSQRVAARLQRVAHAWDYVVDENATLAKTDLVIPPGVQEWVSWTVNLSKVPEGYVRLEIGENAAVGWCASGTLVPGQASMYRMGQHPRMRAIHHTLSFRVAPAQPVYGAEQVVSGETRPHQSVNLWRSNPAEPLPQWLELAWDAPQQVGKIDLTFPGQLIVEVHGYPPFFRDPQCARDYRVEAWVDGAWKTLFSVTGNYQRQRRHVLEQAVKTTKLRLLITATNGDPSAAVYEVRCYG